jgi:hypothetical protein
MATFEQRLERLEKSQKRYRFATIGLLCLMVAGVSMGQMKTTIIGDTKDLGFIVCAGLSVVNIETGKPLITLGGTDSGGTVTTYSSSGEGLLELGGTDSGGAIYIYNKMGEGIVTLKADENGNGEVGAWNRNGKGRTLVPR